MRGQARHGVVVVRTGTEASSAAKMLRLDGRRRPRVRRYMPGRRPAEWRWDCPTGRIAGIRYPSLRSAYQSAAAHVARCDHCVARSDEHLLEDGEAPC